MENNISENSAVLVNEVVSHFKAPIKWRDDIEPAPLTQYEKDMLKGTLTPAELIKQEEKEKEEEVKVDIERQKRRDYITMVKVVAIDILGKYPLSNPSHFTVRERNKLIEQMKEVMTWEHDKLVETFNKVCVEVLFVPGVDFSKFPVYKY